MPLKLAPDEMRKYAKEMRERGRKVFADGLREQYMTLADQWDQLAETQQRVLESHPELQKKP